MTLWYTWNVLLLEPDWTSNKGAVWDTELYVHHIDETLQRGDHKSAVANEKGRFEV